MIRRLPLLALFALLPVACQAPATGPARLAALPAAPAAGPAAASDGADGAGLVSAADPRAAAAGAAILRQGGTATDAAIATMLALGVVEPQSSGIGGGGFLVAGDAAGRVETFDGRETAPAAAGPDWFAVDGRTLTTGEAIPGGRSVGVPGNLRLAALAHAQHGRLPWASLFAPAIALARDGFVITPRLRASLDRARRTGAFDAAGRALFYGADGEPLPAGTLVRNPALAATLEQVAAAGADWFYGGDNAAAIVAHVNTAPRNPSAMTLDDLAGYRAVRRDPVCGRYRQWRICSMGPPTAGGVIVLQALGQLERFDLSALGPQSPVAWHLIAESERLAFADRDRHLADPDHVRVPVAGLLDPAYIAGRSALIAAGSTLPVAPAGSPAGMDVKLGRADEGEEHGTTHFVAVDRAGNVASYTSTVEGPFGSGLMVGGYFLNNELTDFNLAPLRDGRPTANRVEGGKRPRSSMSPVVIYGPDGTLRLAVGAAGGLTIPAQVIRVIIGTLDWHLPARDAIALGVVMPIGDMLAVEAGTPLEGMVPALQALGHANVRVVPLGLKANAIERVADGAGTVWRGAADPRSEGGTAAP